MLVPWDLPSILRYQQLEKLGKKYYKMHPFLWFHPDFMLPYTSGYVYTKIIFNPILFTKFDYFVSFSKLYEHIYDRIYNKNNCLTKKGKHRNHKSCKF